MEGKRGWAECGAPVAGLCAFPPVLSCRKARWIPSEVGLEVYAALFLLEVGALIEVSVHKEDGALIEVGVHKEVGVLIKSRGCFI